ncbi:MAG TPA: PilZ domain-containing protein [Labilithrix sp.]
MAPTGTPTSSSYLDRRRSHRARLAAMVTVTVGGRLTDAVGADVSPGGIRLVAGDRARVGDDVSIVFFLDGDIVCARGVVRWCAPTRNGLFTFGVAFAIVEDDGPSLLARFCGASLS